MSIVKASSKYQVAIPKAIRDKLGIKKGQNLLVTEQNGAIVLTPVPSDPIQYLCGALEGEESLTAELLRERKLDE